jgi:hypothetical protein
MMDRDHLKDLGLDAICNELLTDTFSEIRI